MADIFLSYASQDRERVRPLVSALTASGWTVFWDRTIPTGQAFDEVLEREIAAAGCVVVVWTEAAVKSKWVRNEASEGDDRDMLVPAMLDPDIRIPLAFKRLQAADLTEWDGTHTNVGFENLVNAVTRLVPPSQRVDVRHGPQIDDHAMEELLSHDRRRIRRALSKLPDQRRPEYVADMLARLDRGASQRTATRVAAAMALEIAGDPRFRPTAFHLPDDGGWGFVEVPTGPFLMGSDALGVDGASAAELPLHKVDLPTFYIGRYPVTVAQFRSFLDDAEYWARGTRERSRRPYYLYRDYFETDFAGRSNHPIVHVSWNDAMAYCQWLTAKLSGDKSVPEPLATLLRGPAHLTLPSEAEWEKAARGDTGRIYPWGDQEDPDLANGEETALGKTAPVGCFAGGASPYGVEDMSGNVWEWTRTRFQAYPYDERDGRNAVDEMPPDRHERSSTERRVLRGGAYSNAWDQLRCAARRKNDPYIGLDRVGFRVACVQR